MDPVRRFSRRLRGWLDAFLTPAEDPRRTFASPDAQARALLDRIRAALDDIAATERGLTERVATLGQEVALLEGQARRDLLAGRDDQARHALELRHLASRRLRSSEARLQEMKENEQRLLRLEQRVRVHLDVISDDETAKAVRQLVGDAGFRRGESPTGSPRDVAADAPTSVNVRRHSREIGAWIAAMEDLVEREFRSIAIGEAVDTELAELMRRVEMVEDSSANTAAKESESGRDPPRDPRGIG
jgi:phage shock protein A